MSFLMPQSNSPVDIRPGVLGNLKVNNLNSGQNATSGTFWRGDGTWASQGSAGDPFFATPNYGGSNGQPATIQVVDGTVATPNSTSDAVAIFEKISNSTTTSAQNCAIYGAIEKYAFGNLQRAQALYTEAVDQVGGTGSFIEGARLQATLNSTTHGTAEATGAVGVGGCSVGVNYAYLVGFEGTPVNNSGTNATTTFSSAKFAAGFVATSSFGTNKCDVGYLVNPFNNPVGFIYGFYAPSGSIDSTGTAFKSDASITNGVDLTGATISGNAYASPGFYVNGSGSFGYGPAGNGTGGQVTQITSITTSVTINKICGLITTVSNNFTANTPVGFTVNNSLVAATDTIIVNMNTPNGMVFASNVAAGSFQMNLYPLTTATSTLQISYAVIKAVNT